MRSTPSALLLPLLGAWVLHGVVAVVVLGQGRHPVAEPDVAPPVEVIVLQAMPVSPPMPVPALEVLRLRVRPPESLASAEAPRRRDAVEAVTARPDEEPILATDRAISPETSRPTPSGPAAPEAPSAQDWALAATYTLKNSKRYRYNWGQHVRSLMGAAVEGSESGTVRFRVTIGSDGRLASLETLWATSEAVENRARRAVQALPDLPPTPQGRPLVFEKTIAFQPFESGWPPIYKNDCLPDPPKFRNAFAWNGQGAPGQGKAFDDDDAPEPQDLEACRKQLPKDSIEAEAADMQRQIEQWGSLKVSPLESAASPR